MFPVLLSLPAPAPPSHQRHRCTALRAAAAQAQRKGVCLPGNPSPRNRVSRDTARDALTSAPKAQGSPPAGTATSRADRRGGGLEARRPDSASARRKREPEAGWRGGGGRTQSSCMWMQHPTPTPGPSTSGKSWLSTEEGREDRLQPRRVRADPKEDRERPRGSSIHSTAHAGSEATGEWRKGCSAGAPLLPRLPFSSSELQFHHFLLSPPPPPRIPATTGDFSTLKAPHFAILPLEPFL